MSENVVCDNELLCVGCKRILNDPHTLICGHAFCKHPCLETLTGKNGSVQCPFCYIEMPASTVIVDSALVDRLRQYFIAKCKTNSIKEKVNRINKGTARPPLPGQLSVNRPQSSAPQLKKESQQTKRITRSSQRTGRDNRATVNPKGSSTSVPPTAKQMVRQCNSVRRPTSLPTSLPTVSVNSRKIFVNRLKPKVTAQALQAEFSRFGSVVDARMIMDKKTGNSKCCGVVTFVSSAAVKAVLAERNIQICGGAVTVRNYLTPSKNTPKQTPSAPKISKPSVPINEECEASKVAPKKTESPHTSPDNLVTDETIPCVYVGHLRPDVTRSHLVEYFCKFGKIERVFVFKPSGSQTSLGFGFVYFAEASAALQVLHSGPHRIGTSEVLIRIINKDKLHTGSSFRRAGRDNHTTVNPKESSGSVPPPTAKQAVGQCASVRRPVSLPAASVNSRKIFVGCLKPKVTAQALQARFSRFGRVVDARVIVDKKTGASKCCGYVTFDSPATVEAVLAERNIQVCGGAVTVQKYLTPTRNTSKQTPSAPKTSKPCPPIAEEFKASNVAPNKTGNPPTPPDITVTDETIRCVYVGHLKSDVTKAHLVEYFCKFGKIERAFVFQPNGSQTSLGFGFVYFTESCAALQVLHSGPHRIGTSEVLIRLIDKDKLHMGSRFRRAGGDNHASVNPKESSGSAPPTAKQMVRQCASVRRPTSLPTASVNSRKIFVDRLKPKVTAQALQAKFSRFGSVLDARVIVDKKTGNSNCCGVVTFVSSAAVKAVLAERNIQVCGGAVTVRNYLTPSKNTPKQTPPTPKTTGPTLNAKLKLTPIAATSKCAPVADPKPAWPTIGLILAHT